MTDASRIITQTDVDMAKQALIDGWWACPSRHSGPCDRACDLSEITGCKAMVGAVAEAIALARKL